MSLKVLIVDDEDLAREGCRTALEADSDISTILEVRSGREAVDTILEIRPDFVFLAIQMPGMDGFAVMDEIGAAAMPNVVLVTGDDKYAVRAFELNAIDYLLKPVSNRRWTQALSRLKSRLRESARMDVQRQVGAALHLIGTECKCPPRIAVPTAGKTVFIDVMEIDWIQGAQNYVLLHVREQSLMVRVRLNVLTNSLDPRCFMRVQRSTIVNLRRVRELEVADHGEYVLTLSTGARLRSGRTYGRSVRALMSNSFER